LKLWVKGPNGSSIPKEFLNKIIKFKPKKIANKLPPSFSRLKKNKKQKKRCKTRKSKNFVSIFFPQKIKKQTKYCNTLTQLEKYDCNSHPIDKTKPKQNFTIPENVHK
jgi:hypothetical protein